MKFYILTLSLNSMPYLGCHLPQFNKLKCDWEWHVISGVAEPLHCTAWCVKMPPQLSTDGSHEYMQELALYHPRVYHHFQESWPGKVSMLNHVMPLLTEPGIILQVDSDEIWAAHQIEAILDMFQRNPDRDSAFFKCDYWVGHNLRISTRGTYGDNDYEWLRAFRYHPGMLWIRHEPPVLGDRHRNPFKKQETEAMGMVFQHYAYATEAQVAWKEKYYNYPGAVEGWRRLQQNMDFPCPLRNYFPWVKDNALVERIA